MSKELEALDRLTEHLDLDDEYFYKGEKYDEEIIKQALQELQAIKSAKHSEALEIINKMLYGVEEFEFINLEMVLTRDLEKVKKALLKAQEQEKVLSIIIKKNVSVWGFRNRVFGYQKKQNGNRTINDTYENYLNMFGCYHNGFDIELLTEEEFNTLKEYFK